MNRDRTSSDSLLDTFDRHRSLLFSIAYRMLGSVADAEEVVQEAYLRWRRASGREVNSPKTPTSPPW
jgi:RNA polymerase sigma-70 factor (ECF subfamily)